MIRDLFTPNKQKVREMNFRLIERHFRDRQGTLRYLGLPASTLTDILQWQSYFQHFSAIERGRPHEEYRYQHDLMLTAQQYGLADRLALLRGDIDDVLIRSLDTFGNPLQYPFDVVSLDYSGGVIYKDQNGHAKRVESIESLLKQQAIKDQNFLLLISCNLDNEDAGEIRAVFADMQNDLLKVGVHAQQIINAHLKHELDEVRLRVYVPYLIRGLCGAWYQCNLSKPIYYAGNHDTRMMNFSMWLKRSQYVAGRPNSQTLISILNLPAFHCVNGELDEVDFGLPKLAVG